MAGKYDCHGYCMNLKEESLREKGETGILGNPKGYYCALTDQRCVGAKESCWKWVNDELRLDIVGRCPSGETIDDALKTSEAVSE